MNKEPISTLFIKKTMDNFATKKASLKDLRIGGWCTLVYAGFFCFRELKYFVL